MSQVDQVLQERRFLSALENVEASRIAMGDYDSFVKIETVSLEAGLELSKGLDAARSLAGKGFVLLDHSSGTAMVKSRMANAIKSLYHTTTLVQRRIVRDVSDLKYLRFVKQIPQYTITLDTRETREALLAYLGSIPGPEQSILEKSIQALASKYPTISAFQLSASRKILELLSGKKESRSLVIVAETGAGKTLAYELPLLLWILSKKIRAYLQKGSSVKPAQLNCSALLLFPRNVLAKDQYDDLVDLSATLSENLKKLSLPSDLTSFLEIKIERDFGGVDVEERTRVYQSCPDIIITNCDTLKRRLMNPLCGSLYTKGVDLVLYDEVHLYDGLFGANVASLNARLQNLLHSTPVFVGMSATVANPQKHCQKLFSIAELPDIVTDRDDILMNFSLEHHVILKPRAGRPSLGVCIDTTSTLLHNRRDGTFEAHQQTSDLRPKTLCFVDSLDLTGRWEWDQRNYENFYEFPAVKTQFRRGYPVHYAPLGVVDPSLRAACLDCKAGHDVIASICNEYGRGNCWWFSHDSASPGRWIPYQRGVTPNDNIRVKRLTSQEVNLSELDDIYALFHDHYLNLPLDGLVATSVLEVGVDFKQIKEVVMYGEIRSPSSYKQKSGRGAREGNMDDGLMVMTVVPPSPLANFYYMHFYRLVHPSLAPLPLEPRNSDIVRSHAFCAVFDFLASIGVDVFNVISANQNAEQVEQQFNRAISFISTGAQNVEGFVIGYLRRLGHPTSQARDIAQEAVENALMVLNKLSSEYEIKGNRKKLIIWVFEAFRDRGTMSLLEEDFEQNLEERAKEVKQIAEARESFALAKKRLLSAISLLGERYVSDSTEIQRILSQFEGA